MFQKKLQEYLYDLPCTAKELSDSSGLSAAVISRYISGARRPAADSTQLQDLARGIAAIAAARGRADVSEAFVLQELISLLKEESNTADSALFIEKLNALIDVLGIRNVDLSRALNFDASYLSKVRSGERHFSDPHWCALQVGRYVTQRYSSPEEISRIAGLTAAAYADAEKPAARAELLADWLISGAPLREKKGVDRFLQKLDEFDLNQYIRQIRFDSMKVPPPAARIPSSHFFEGLEEMMECELRFLKMTVLSRRSDPVVLYSDMPMQEMSKNEDFARKWMFGLAMMLKKGLHLHSVHNVDRPFEEMLLGLEIWIPMYMTGQISPYYLTGVQNNVFLHFLRVSGAAAVEGAAIAGHQKEGRYYLTNRSAELAKYRKRADRLLEKARPLMQIYREDSREAFRTFLEAESRQPGCRRAILSSLPLYTLSKELLSEILAHNRVPEADRLPMQQYVEESRARMLRILEHSTAEDTIPLLTPEEFAAYPICLPLAGIFYEENILYTYAQYQEHLRLTRRFAEEQASYTLRQAAETPFRNIRIQLLEDQWALVSKNRSPVIHFVIRHPKLVQAIDDLISLQPCSMTSP